MNPSKIQGANAALGAPEDWDADKQGECATLPVRINAEAGTIESAWEPSDEEKAAIAAGRPVILTIWGRLHPPVSVNVEAATRSISLDGEGVRVLRDHLQGALEDWVREYQRLAKEQGEDAIVNFANVDAASWAAASAPYFWKLLEGRAKQ